MIHKVLISEKGNLYLLITGVNQNGLNRLNQAQRKSFLKRLRKGKITRRSPGVIKYKRNNGVKACRIIIRMTTIIGRRMITLIEWVQETEINLQLSKDGVAIKNGIKMTSKRERSSKKRMTSPKTGMIGPKIIGKTTTKIIAMTETRIAIGNLITVSDLIISM